MPAPSPLTIATSAVLRLLKEEVSYHKELVDQEAQVKILEEKIKSGAVDEDCNDDFMVKQRKTAIEQTKAVFEPLKKQIADAVIKLEEQIALREGSEIETDVREVDTAKTVLTQAKAVDTIDT